MDGSLFDDLIRSLAGSRRSLVSGTLAGAAGWLGLAETNARKKRKRRRKAKKSKPRARGCLADGQACNGDSANCCSGICEGVKPKNGEPDSSRCVANGANICDGRADYCTTGVAIACHANNPDCACLRTTDNATFCGDVTAGAATLCRECRRDADCEAEFGPSAACVVVGGFCDAYCPGTGGTACVRVCSDAPK